MASNPYGIQEPKKPEMPGMVSKMANGFAYQGQKDIYNMDDPSRGDYWRRLNSYAAQNNDTGEDYDKYLGSLNNDLLKEYRATQNRNPDVRDYRPEGDRNFFLSPTQIAAGRRVENSGFGQRSDKDIYGMDDASRTQYWQDLRAAQQASGETGTKAREYLESLSPELRKDFEATATGAGNFYLTPEQRMKKLQQMQAEEFRKGIPQTARQMGEDLRSETNKAMNASMKQTSDANASRGLLYSGINRGQKAGIRAKAQAGLAAGIAGINTDLENTANSMENAAVESGKAIQQNEQEMQRQIYQQAMARMNSNNAIMGSALSLAGTAGILYATGGIGALPALGIGGGAIGAGLLSQR